MIKEAFFFYEMLWIRYTTYAGVIGGSVYAAWKSYLLITADKTVFDPLGAASSSLGGFVLMSSPADPSIHNTASIYQTLTGKLNTIGSIENYGGFTYRGYAARPALHKSSMDGGYLSILQYGSCYHITEMYAAAAGTSFYIQHEKRL